MSDPGAEGSGAEDDEARRRRLRQQVFGDVLPDTTADERDEGAPDPAEGGHDEWLRSNVPPHHG